MAKPAPATSAPAERIFSAGRRVVNDLRHSLEEDTIAKILSMKTWYRMEDGKAFKFKG